MSADFPAPDFPAPDSPAPDSPAPDSLTPDSLAPFQDRQYQPPGERARRLPPGWEVETTTDDVEALLLRLPPEVTQINATMRLAISAEFGGWELKRTRRYPDGSRKVLLRRKRARTRPRGAGPGIESA